MDFRARELKLASRNDSLLGERPSSTVV
jgi:hypothetical protein